LDDFAYKKNWTELTKKEQDIVLSLDDHKSMKASDICTATGMSNSLFSQYRKKLIDKGILTSPSYGYVELTLLRLHKICQYYE